MTSGELILALLGSAGFLTGIGGLLHFLNTRKPTRYKSSADAYSAYSTWVAGVVNQTTAHSAAVEAERDKANVARADLVDLVQLLIRRCRALGMGETEVEEYQDLLDEIRAR